MHEAFDNALGLAKAVAFFLVRTLAVVLIIASCNFSLVRAAPGDPAIVLAGESGATDARYMETVRHAYGLDQPLMSQYWRYISSVLSLDLGFSHREGRPVIDIIGARIVPTLLLTMTAFGISVVAGSVLGLLAAARRDTIVDRLIVAASVVCYAVPPFWLGLMLIYLFSVNLGWFPPFGMVTIDAADGISMRDAFVDFTQHLALPAASLSIIYIAIYTRLMRQAANEAISSDYIRTARAKGLSAGAILYGEVLPNAIVPVITFAGMHAATLLGGSIVVETVFAWPGLGRLTFDAVMQRNYPVLLGVFLILSVLVVVLNALSDVLVRVLDPRIGAHQ